MDNTLKFFNLRDDDPALFAPNARWFLVRADSAPGGPEVREVWDLNAGDGTYLSYARSKDGEVSLRFAPVEAPPPGGVDSTLMVADLSRLGVMEARNAEDREARRPK